MSQEIQARRAAALACGVAGALFLLKLSFGLAMGSVAILSEALNSSLDIVATLAVVFLIRKAFEPADSSHPFGHGKLETLAGLGQMILVAFLGAWVIISALRRFIHPHPIEKVSWGILAMAVSLVVTFFLWRHLRGIAKETGSVALEASSVEFSMDLFTNLGVIITLAAINLTGLQFLDPVAGLAVLTIIVVSARPVFARALGDLLEESLPNTVTTEINQVIEKTLASHYPKLTGFHKLRSRRSGFKKLIDLHLLGCKKLELGEAHELAHRLEANLTARFPEMDVLIHSEPCEEDCESCQRLKRDLS